MLVARGFSIANNLAARWSYRRFGACVWPLHAVDLHCRSSSHKPTESAYRLYDDKVSSIVHVYGQSFSGRTIHSIEQGRHCGKKASDCHRRYHIQLGLRQLCRHVCAAAQSRANVYRCTVCTFCCGPVRTREAFLFVLLATEGSPQFRSRIFERRDPVRALPFEKQPRPVVFLEAVFRPSRRPRTSAGGCVAAICGQHHEAKAGALFALSPQSAVLTTEPACPLTISHDARFYSFRRRPGAAGPRRNLRP